MSIFNVVSFTLSVKEMLNLSDARETKDFLAEGRSFLLQLSFTIDKIAIGLLLAFKTLPVISGYITYTDKALNKSLKSSTYMSKGAPNH